MKIVKRIYCRIYQLVLRILIPFLPYRNPEIVSGVLELPNVLKKNGCSHVLLVTDKGIRSLGLTEELEQALKDNDLPCTVYDGTDANPTTANVAEAEELYKSEGCDAIIGFGGGSSMDCAKAVGARIARPDKTLAQMAGILKVHKQLPLLAAVPTTAGTGSETTLAAVIVDAQTRHKYTINAFVLIPRYAVLEPKATLTLPPSITSTTGLDALTHAIEAYIGRSTTRDTRRDAEQAVQLVFKNLDKAYTTGSDEEARKNMLQAAYYAGCAFTKSYVGYVHAVAHSYGGEYNIAHGLAVAIALPYVLEGYGTKIYKKLAKLAVVAGIASEDMSTDDAARAFLTAIRDMRKRFNIPDTVKQLRKEDIPKLSGYADHEANPLYPVPVLMDAKHLEKFYYMILEEQETETEKTDIHSLVEKQRAFYDSGQTLSVDFRKQSLEKLRAGIAKYEDEINEALRRDLGKSAYESYMCEVGLTLSELTYMQKHLAGFARERKVKTPLAQFRSRSYVKPSPHGVTLIMSPWNYPILLTLDPLIDALAAGNTVILKPSAYSPHTSDVLRRMFASCFPESYVAVVTGGRAENSALLEEQFDYIFFTGSKAVGHEVMRKAAEHLTPVTLELGGKCPCLVDATANIKLTAKRIVFGKFVNCGQTCVAPDYIYCDPSVREELISELKEQIREQFGAIPLSDPDYGKIINQHHFERICGLIDPDKVVCGGQNNPETLQIAPTVMDHVTFDDPVMQEEIFGPILPVLTYDYLDAAVEKINSMEYPLALYLFTSSKEAEQKVMSEGRFGGGCVNDVVIHLATSEMGFGGFGASGIGSYHGWKGFETFSHEKSIVDKKTGVDMPMRYQPYQKKYEGLVHRLLH